MSDEELWARVRAGDHEAFGEPFQRHAQPVFQYCLRSHDGLQDNGGGGGIAPLGADRYRAMTYGRTAATQAHRTTSAR